MVKDYFIIFICIVMGILTASWLTITQAEFLSTIGLSKLAVVALEPSLALVALLLGYRISGFHRFLSLGLFGLLFCASLIATSSLYTKHLFAEVKQTAINEQQVTMSKKNEDVIREALDNLVHRGASSKSTLALIGKLENQQKITQEKSEVTDLSAIVGIISTLFNLEERKALIGFALLISFTTVSIPSFCFFSFGLLVSRIRKPEEDEENEILDRMVAEEEAAQELSEEPVEASDMSTIIDDVSENMRKVVEEMDVRDIANNCKQDLYSKIEGSLSENIDELVEKITKETMVKLRESGEEIERALLTKIKNDIINQVNVTVQPEIKDVKDRVAVKVEKNLRHYTR